MDTEKETQKQVIDTNKVEAQPVQEDIVPQKEEDQESEHPNWYTVNTEDDYVEVKTKDGTFQLEDVPYEKVQRAKQRVMRGKTDQVSMDNFEMALISVSLKGTTTGELDLVKFRTSTIMRLRYAVSQLYDLESFLQ